MDYESFKEMCLERSSTDSGYAIAYAALVAGESQRMASGPGRSAARAAQIRSLSLPFSAEDRVKLSAWLKGRTETCLPQVWRDALRRPKEEYANRQNVMSLSALMQSLGWKASGRRTRLFGYGQQMVYAPVQSDTQSDYDLLG